MARALGEKGHGYGAAGDCIRHYWHGLPAQVQNQIQHALSENGLEQFDAVLAADKDELIDPDTLAENYLEAYATVESLSPKESR
ncbi:hypothetical protein FYZ35_06275 [Mobiluncus mulieris]|nr:hypothetical protein [Mobiluncus mulieris]MCV0014204.1 hypothetical protein [Mobiluncus mulieris]